MTLLDEAIVNVSLFFSFWSNYLYIATFKSLTCMHFWNNVAALCILIPFNCLHNLFEYFLVGTIIMQLLVTMNIFLRPLEMKLMQLYLNGPVEKTI